MSAIQYLKKGWCTHKCVNMAWSLDTMVKDSIFTRYNVTGSSEQNKVWETVQIVQQQMMIKFPTN